MKFRSLVLLSALAALSVPAVEVTGSNTFGWLKVDSGLANTIVAVPWVECGTGEAIKVANLVKTDNLTAGDKLYVYMGGTWYLYVLTDGAWTASTTVGANGPEVAEAPANQTLARGAALFLQRADTTKPFYLYGQYDATAVQTAITAGTSAAPVHTLVASPKAADFDLNGKTWTNVDAGDRIVVPMGVVSREYTWREADGWGYNAQTTKTKAGKTVVSTTRTTTGCTIPAGTGFWYVSQGGSPTIAW